MQYAYMYDRETKHFVGKVPIQRDPLESEIAGHDIFTMPGDSVTIPMELEKKDGFFIVWNEESNEWQYKENENAKGPEPYIPTELDKAYDILWKYKGKLNETDYINAKISDAENMGNKELANELRTKYASVFADREIWRQQVRKWEAEVDRLKVEQEIEAIPEEPVDE